MQGLWLETRQKARQKGKILVEIEATLAQTKVDQQRQLMIVSHKIIFKIQVQTFLRPVPKTVNFL
jgi:hypothetical protein